MRMAARSFAVAWLATSAAVLCLWTSTAASAAAGIEVVRAVAAPSLAGAPSGMAELVLRNTGTAPDHLVSAASPAAGSVELHRMTMNGEVMSMRRVDTLPIAPGRTVRIDDEAGLHLMLMGLKQPLKAGDAVPLTLTFDKAGRVETTLKVQAATARH